MSTIIEQIKAKQIAEALERGDKHPYEDVSAPDTANEQPARQGLAAKIKAKQLEDDPELYAVAVQKPVVANADTLFEQLQAAMVTDIARIKSIKNLEEKQALKRDLLPGYQPFIDEYVASGDNYPCSVAVQAMIWLFDINDIENGLALGLHLMAIGHQSLPPTFNRDLPTFIADAMYDWANEQLRAQQSASPYLDELVTTVSVDRWDLHPAVISKNLVMMAKHRFREGDFAECVSLCERAEDANPKGAGVKTLKNNAVKELKK